MKKKLLLILAALIAAPIACFSAVTAVTIVPVPAVNLYPMDTNVPVMQYDITATSDEALTSFLVVNQGTADEPLDIATVKLWYRPSGGTFDPAASTLVAVIPRTGNKTWSDTALSFNVTNGSSLYVTVDMIAAPRDTKTLKMRANIGSVVFGVSNSFPALVTSGTNLVVSNPGYMYATFSGMMPEYADRGQAGVNAMILTFRNTLASDASVTGIRLQAVNYAGGINASAALSRIKVTGNNGTITHADMTAMPVSSTVDVAFSTPITVPAGGAPVPVTVSADLAAGINTYDIGFRIAQETDITAGASIVAGYMGTTFPLVTSRSILTQANSSVNAAHNTLMPANVTRGQQNLKPFVIRFTHPQPVTAYASCVVKGVTITAVANDSAVASAMFTGMKVSDGITQYSGTAMLDASSGRAWIPFSQNLTVTAGTYREVTVLADVKATIPSASFYMSLSRSADVAAVSGSAGNALAVVMVSSLTSTAAVIQDTISNMGIHHTNSMPAYAAKSQSWVKAADFVITHPDSGNNASIEVKGITLNVEDSLGAGIVPSSVISKLTVLDSLNNTVLSYSSIPSSGNQLFLNFSTPQILAPASSRTLKIYIDIPASPSGTHVKLNLNAPSGVNAVDYNSRLPITVLADSGDSFAMRTTAAQLVDAAVDLKVKHTDIMPVSVNMGQANAGAMLLYFANTTAGVASVDGIKFRFTDSGGTTIAAAGVVNNVRLDMAGNTAAVYAEAAVTTTANTLDITLSQPIILNASASNAVTITARFTIANPALLDYFRISVLTAASITAKDNNLGTGITVNALNDSFPMQSGLAHIDTRATGATIQHTPVATGPVNKGDPGIEVMEFAFENPGNTMTSSVSIIGITLTAENGTGAISANTVFSRISAYEKGNPGNMYGEISSIGTSQYLYLRFTNPVIVTPSASPGNVTVVVSADISGAASQTQFRLNLASAGFVTAGDANQGLYVTVTAKAPDSFPDMRSNLISLQAGTKLKVLHEDTMPPTASNGQQGIMPMTLRFANTTDQTASIKGLTLTVKDAANAGLVPSTRISAVRVVDATGTTNISTASILSTGSKIYLTFTGDLYVAASSYEYASIYVDLADNTYTSDFKLSLENLTDIDWLPNTMSMEADAGHVFPMESGVVQVQYKPVLGNISHNDVIPTTVSTGQVDIFAEILNLYNPNITGTADIMLTGITLTVEDDTNTAIDPTTALKRILVKDGSNVYSYFTAMPSAASPFYVPFDSPIYIGVSQTVNARLYIDIVDTLQAGTFRINIKISNDVKFCDANSGSVIPAAAMNGDSFPMTTSSVIIQEAITGCEVTHADLMPLTANRGQQDVGIMRLDFKNPGGPAAANMAITRIGLYVQDDLNAALIARNALSKITIKDGSGTVYAVVNSVPDNSAFVSIGLTTPITVQPGATKQIFVTGDINPAAPAAGFKMDLDKNTDVIARDSNSYEILNVTASGDSFPMRSSYLIIQDKSTALSLAALSLLPAAVNKAQADVPVMYLEFTNVQGAGYSSIGVRGITITVENSSGTGIAPDEVLSLIKATDGGSTTYGSVSSIPSSGTMVYLPLTNIKISAGIAVGVTLYADIAAVTSRLYFMLDVNSQGHIDAFEKNSGDSIGTITASYPLRTSVSTILSTPGIKVHPFTAAWGSISAGQAGVAALQFEFTNIGSLSEQVEGITITVKDQFGTAMNAQTVISALSITDDSYNFITATAVSGAGAQVYLDFSGSPVIVPPQSSVLSIINFDAAASASGTQFYLSAESGSITATAGVSALAGHFFPMDSNIFMLQPAAVSASVYATDYMPPNVSTGQSGVYVMKLTVSNTGAAGSAPVVLRSLNALVLDSAGGTIPASSVISKLEITDLATAYLNTTAIAGTPYLDFLLQQPVTITAGGSADLYYIVDVAGNTGASSFKLSFTGSDRFYADDYNSAAEVTVNAAAGYSFPMESSAAQIQAMAQQLVISGSSLMPAVVSTGQQGVQAVNFILTDAGNTSTASIMLTRFNIYVMNPSGVTINASNVIDGLAITSGDGSVVYGTALPVSGSSKVTVNLTAPIIVSAAAPVTALVTADIAPIALSPSFKLGLEAVSDIYAVDANSFDIVPVAEAVPGSTMPIESGSAVIEDKQPGVSLTSFTPLLPAGVTRGQAGAPVMAFTIENNAVTGTADAVLLALRVNFMDGSDAALPANTALNTIYLLDASGSTLAASGTTLYDNIVFNLGSPAYIPAGTSLRVTLTADISGSATADDFKVAVTSSVYVAVVDENSGSPVSKTVSPSMPWDSGTAAIYDAPATAASVWHNALMPTQVGRGQSKVMMMALSMYNPGGQGTSDVALSGVTLSVKNSLDAPIAPDSVLSFVEFTDLTGTYFYGGATATSGVLYVPADAYISAAASNTVTVYLKAKISSSASLVSFKTAVDSAGFIGAHNNPAGYVTITASNGDVFPMESGVTNVIASTNIVKMGNENLMPVSAVRGQAGVGVIKFSLRNESSVDIGVTGITLTVKARNGSLLNADSVLGAASVTDASGNTVYGTAVPGASSKLAVNTAFVLGSFTEDSIAVYIDIAAAASGDFYLELENDTDVSTDQPASIQPASGYSFGMRSQAVSLQKAKLEDSFHNFPNPFDPETEATHIEYYLENTAEVTIKILTLDGRPVANLLNKAVKSAGLHYEDVWDGKNGAGKSVKSGVYLCVMEVTSSGATKMLVKKIGVLR